MNFSTYETDEAGLVMIMSTRRDTKKFQSLLLNPKVAILVHDFATSREIVAGDNSTERGELYTLKHHYTNIFVLITICAIVMTRR